MIKYFRSLVAAAALSIPVLAQAGSVWQQVSPELAPASLQLMHPTFFKVYTLDEATLRSQLFNVSSLPEEGVVVSLPLPDGSSRAFRVWQSSMMPDELAARFPDIRTFRGEAVGNRSITVSLDFTMYGFHAMILDGSNTSFIDPYDNYHDGFYMVHYKKDETRALADRMKCTQPSHKDLSPIGQSMDIVQKGLEKIDLKTINGAQLRTYRLALACDSQYAQAATGLASPSVAQVFSKMTTSMNRINGVLEREVSVKFVFVANENLLIFTSGPGDPYAADNSNPNNLFVDNQTQCDNLIGNANYDFGHVFTTGSGGQSIQGCVCEAGYKAQSTTGAPSPVGDGFDIDYVIHEYGHALGCDHTFNNASDGSCFDNINTPTAFEPGSGSTIMAYAGICGPDDVQFHSDPYFHTASLQQISDYITTAGEVCAVKTSTGNKLVGYAPFAATYSIPFKTPFELYGPVLTDSVADSATLYCWEEMDAGVGNQFVNTFAVGPLFRSFNPTPSNLRIFPKLSMVLSGVQSDAGTEGAEGEKLPDVARSLTFVCTFRDIYNNFGSFTIPDDRITLNAINTGAGFAVTSQSTTGISYSGHSTQTVTWNVVGTSLAPINAANVDIYMSVDGGLSFIYHVGSFPNTGSASIVVPNPAASASNCRFKVKGSGNVFFNVNSANFAVTHDPAYPISASVKPVVSLASEVNVYPVPANDLLHIAAPAAMNGAVYNTLGQKVWEGRVYSKTELDVRNWARGLYYLQLKDTDNQLSVKRFILQ